MSRHDDQRRNRGDQQRGGQQGWQDPQYAQHQQRSFDSPSYQQGGGSYQGSYPGSQQGGQQRGNYGSSYGSDAYGSREGSYQSGYEPAHSQGQGYRGSQEGGGYQGGGYEGGGYQGGGYSRGAQGYRSADNSGATAGSAYRGQGGDFEGYSGGRGWSGTEYDYQDRRRSYGSQGSGSGRPHYDPDYDQWRNQQLSELDRDYDTWRQERYKKFSDDFTSWRSNRASNTANRGSTDETDVDSGLSAGQVSSGTAQSGKDAKTK